MFVVDSTVALRVLREDDAAELFALTDVNRAYLRRWLPWVDLVTSEEDSRSFLTTVTAQREEGRGPTFGVLCDGALAGVVGFLPVDRVNRIGEIGYWLAPRRQGRHQVRAQERLASRQPTARRSPPYPVVHESSRRAAEVPAATPSPRSISRARRREAHQAERRARPASPAARACSRRLHEPQPLRCFAVTPGS